MPVIKAFQAIHPLSTNVKDVVCTIEEMSLDVAKNIRANNPISFIHLLVPELITTLHGSEKKELVFNKINQNLEDFLAKQVLVQDNTPSIYIYSIFSKGIQYTGVWTTTSINDYANRNIKCHEHITPQREEELSTYLERTGIDANPVLLTYKSSSVINQLVSELSNKCPDISFSKDNEISQVWRIDNENHIASFQRAFKQISPVYIADGHHRVSAALSYGMKKRSEKPDWSGSEEFNYFSSVYIPDDQVLLLSYNRLVKGIFNLSSTELLDQLQKNFIVSKAVNKSLKKRKIALYIENNWYTLEPQPHILTDNPLVNTLSASILQDYILEPIFNINNLKSNNQLLYIPGIYPHEVFEERVNSGDALMAFILEPITIDELMKIADSGEVLPPKSTWFEPKFPVGLLIHKI